MIRHCALKLSRFLKRPRGLPSTDTALPVNRGYKAPDRDANSAVVTARLYPSSAEAFSSGNCYDNQDPFSNGPDERDGEHR
jgi:hypothetical protein